MTGRKVSQNFCYFLILVPRVVFPILIWAHLQHLSDTLGIEGRPLGLLKNILSLGDKFADPLGNHCTIATSYTSEREG